LATFARVLPPDELRQAERSANAAYRAVQIASRGLRRLVLARYAAGDAQALAFSRSPLGKPFLEPNFLDLRFNMTHAGSVVACAVTTGAEVGIDVEPLREVPDALELAGRFFAPDERAALETVAAAERSKAFLTCWTRKEAYLKAVGAGLTHPLDAFCVSVRADQPEWLRDAASGQPIGTWSLLPLQVDGAHVGAVAVQGPNWTLRRFSWPLG
jgi:4'-phosphopantetheinyl transferase